ncbi:MAG: abortive phage infection protein [Alteromonadaceae bacterium]|nr:MAG: abortive phage infection protein [Alteromonadaceae bacterium]
MLIRFSVENFRSFRSRTELSLVPGKVRQHPEQVIKANSKKDIAALKAAVIYGANASGKSNLIRAMRHAQKIINNRHKAGQSLPYAPFKLDEHSTTLPSRFEFEIKAGDANYAYGFIADQHRIHEEWLYNIDRQTDKRIFERKGDIFDFSGNLFESQEDEQFLHFTAKGTPENRLFLSECSERNILRELPYFPGLATVSEWFERRLHIIFPDTKLHGMAFSLAKDDGSTEALSTLVRAFDTGIDTLSLQEVDFDKNLQDIPPQLKQHIMQELEPQGRLYISGPDNTRYRIEKGPDAQLKAYKLMSNHKIGDKEVLLDITEESDGTQRLIDLAPGLLNILQEEHTFIIDELDRSLHADITRKIFDVFMHATQGKRSQLIVTTHESNLLDLRQLRKDEFWFVAKNKKGESSLYSMEEFQPRFDKDIRRGYFAGRFGALPDLQGFDEVDALFGRTSNA